MDSDMRHAEHGGLHATFRSALEMAQKERKRTWVGNSKYIQACQSLLEFVDESL